MQMIAYAIFDSASATYTRPFFLLSNGQALRSFKDEATGETPVGAHPEDYSLARIGTYDDERGELKPEPVEILATGLEVVAQRRAHEELMRHQKKLEHADKPARDFETRRGFGPIDRTQEQEQK